MAPALIRATTSSRIKNMTSNNENTFVQYFKKYLNINFMKHLILDPDALPIISVFILLAELLLNVLIIKRVPYTEIDWKAYMQECEGFLNGTTNYALLKGNTGPLVYPAGFVYIYSMLYYVTGFGENIRLAQYIFCLIYLIQLILVLRLYSKSRKVPPYVLIISTFTSYRIHSIYVLRLFNDPIAMLFFYAALNLFLEGRWSWGSICYSWGVACKMNVLLCAPALLLFYIINLGFKQTILQLCICASIQIILGLPFLLTHPTSYIIGSFNLARIFEHKWTVNYRFLPLDTFQHKYFHVSLLIVNVLLILIFLEPTKRFFTNYARLRELQLQLQPQIDQENRKQKQLYDKQQKLEKQKKLKKLNQKSEEKLTQEQEKFLKSFERTLQQTTNVSHKKPLEKSIKIEKSTEGIVSSKKYVHFDQCSQLMLLPFFLCNFIGVMCARSLHYQFYVWYFHTLPYLAWSTNFSLTIRFLLLGLIEFCWNTYPSTNISSILLNVCHLVLFSGVSYNVFKTVSQSQHVKQQQEEEEVKRKHLNQNKHVNTSIQVNSLLSNKIKST